MCEIFESFDVAIIGAGPGGYKTAELLAKNNLSVALIEENAIGGICLNHGCIPFKTYIHTATILHEAERLFSLNLLNTPRESYTLCSDINQEQLLANKNKIVNTLQQSVKTALQHYGVSILHGRATIIKGKKEAITIKVKDKTDKAEKTIEASQLIIASGSEEKQLTIPADVSYSVINSSQMLELDILPKQICIIGAGAIGLEAASYFCDAGSEVTIVEAADHIGGNIDIEIAQSLQRIFEKKGIVIYTCETIREISRNKINLTSGRIIDGLETVLTAVGRIPRIDTQACDLLGVKYSNKGIEIDQQCRTTNPKVFACGDVTGKLMLAHTAYYQAKVIVDTIIGEHSKVEYDIIPRVIYSNPEVLSVGATETTSIDGCITKSLPMTYSGKYFAENGKDGAKAKMIVKAERVIGFHIIGNGVTELSLAAEMMMGMSINKVKNLVYAHPTYGEIIGELAELF